MSGPNSPDIELWRWISLRMRFASTAKPLPPISSLGQAAFDYHLEETPQQVAVAETTMQVLGEGRMIEHCATETKAADSAVGQDQMHFLVALELTVA